MRPQDGAQVRVIHNGINADPIAPGHSQDRFTLLAVGRLDAIKGFDQLIRAVADLDFPFRLHIVGEGPERAKLEKAIWALNLEDSVFMDGFREDIPQMMADSHLVVISSHREGCPMVLLESLFYAPVLISTPAGIIPEVLPPELQCDLAGLHAKITDVHLNYDRYRRLFAQVADQRKEDFSLPVIAGKYLALYEEIFTLSRR
ncbi:MAG TPA: hypothetical protein DEB25_07645 [Desulfobulbaceae bacterium]|nr:hypothetical protein [Desulfobulbaceae bacterium]